MLEKAALEGSGGQKKTVGFGYVLYWLIQHAGFSHNEAITGIYLYYPQHTLQREHNSSFLRKASPSSSRTASPWRERNFILITKSHYRKHLIRMDRESHCVWRKKLAAVVVAIHEAIDRIRIKPISRQ